MKRKIIFSYCVTASLVVTPIVLAFAAEENAVPTATDQPAQQVELTSPSHITGSYLSGQFAKNNGDISRAVRYLQRVHRKDPANKDVSVQLEGMLLLQGRIEEAMGIAQEIRNLENAEAKDPLADLLLALRDIKNNHPDAAAAALDKISAGGNTQLWAPLISAWIDIGRRPFDKPLTIDDLGAEVGRAAPLANYHLALINNKAGFKEEAAKNFRDAVEDPQNPPTRVMRLLLRFYEQNDAPQTLTPIVKAYRDAHPDMPEDNEVPVIATAADGVAEVLYTMGGIMFGAGVLNDAAIYLQLAIYMKPGFDEAKLALGDAYNDLQQYGRANEVYATVSPGRPLYRKAQLHIAVNEDRLGRLKEALALLNKLIAASPTDTDALIARADLLRIHSRFAEAVTAYNEAIKRIPELKSQHWPLLFARAACLDRAGKWPLAEKDLKHALALKPDQPDVLNYLGYAWLERRQHIDEARRMIETAVKERPNDAQIVDSMGWALYLSGNYAGATQYIEKAVELVPSDPTVNDHLGDIYWRLGRKTEARFQWERSLTFSPDEKLADSIHKKLKEGLPPTALADTVPSAGGAATP